MNNINRRFYVELIKNKHVLCDAEIYRYYYKKIWPCELYFKNFLLASDSSVKLDYSKKIYLYMQVFDDIIMPSFLTNNLISTQQDILAKDNMYIPQDHLIHSIYLYILGIYLFFNSTLFYTKLTKSSAGTNVKEQVGSFLEKWRIFSLYHDIGYVFECYVDKDGYSKNSMLLDYKDIEEQILHEYVRRNIARLITSVYHINNSKRQFNIDMEKILNIEWIHDKEILTSTDLTNRLSKFCQYIQIDGINSKDDVDAFSCLFGDEDYLIEYIDKLGMPIAYIIKENDTIDYIYNNIFKDYYLLDIIPYNNYELISDNIIYKYYIKNPAEIIKRIMPAYLKSEVTSYDACIPKDIKMHITMNYMENNIDYECFTVRNWLNKKHAMASSFEETACYEQSLEKALKDIITSNIIDVITEIFKEKKYRNITGIIKNCKQSVAQTDESKVLNAATSYYLDSEGIPNPILHYQNLLRTSIRKTLNCEFDKFKYIDILDDNTVQINLFGFDDSNDFAKTLYEQISKCAGKLGIEIGQLLQYHLGHSRFDHGVISASIVFRSIVFCKSIMKCAQQPRSRNMRLAWNDWNNINNTNGDLVKMDNYADSIFAILLHNIYTKKSNKEYGIEYSQDININSFSYFCAFTDVLQKWGRPKQIDFSIMDLPDEHYLENDFDIEVSESEIKILCNSIHSGNMRQEIDSLEYYLPGASYIIKIVENEQ